MLVQSVQISVVVGVEIVCLAANPVLTFWQSHDIVSRTFSENTSEPLPKGEPIPGTPGWEEIKS
ncbi:MAG: hypothetical protein J7641_11415 [Cyanobacteria bacterium SID2]|nr:hypothetical protein [Cyanobacteria bacterium SID2]